MNILSIFSTTGYIFGPAILVAGLIALMMCLRASSRTSSRTARKAAVVLSLLPFATSILGAFFGLAVWWWSGLQSEDPWKNWLALGQTCLAGLLVTLAPLLWSLLLFRLRQGNPQ